MKAFFLFEEELLFDNIYRTRRIGMVLKFISYLSKRVTLGLSRFTMESLIDGVNAAEAIV